jgi:hypothetical protein
MKTRWLTSASFLLFCAIAGCRSQSASDRVEGIEGAKLAWKMEADRQQLQTIVSVGLTDVVKSLTVAHRTAADNSDSVFVLESMDGGICRGHFVVLYGVTWVSPDVRNEVRRSLLAEFNSAMADRGVVVDVKRTFETEDQAAYVGDFGIPYGGMVKDE